MFLWRSRFSTTSGPNEYVKAQLGKPPVVALRETMGGCDWSATLTCSPGNGGPTDRGEPRPREFLKPWKLNLIT